MCILMYFSPSAMPIKAHLDVACENNPDGFGYAVMTRDGIVTGHGMDPDRVIEEFLYVRGENPDDTAMFHARIATQGSVCLDNCHPFQVGYRPLKAPGATEVQGQMFLAHNGMLPVYPGKGDDRSDTKLFAEEIFMRRFPHLDSVKTQKRIEAYLGTSKLVVMTNDPAYRQQAYIFNQKLGVWIDHEGTGDIWYSNTSYKTYRYSSGSYGAYTGWSWPTTVGAASKRRYTFDDYDDAAWMDSTTRLACAACEYAIVYCRCIGTVKGVYLPYGQVKTPSAATLFTTPVEEDDDPSAEWTCVTCETVGSINDAGECRWCGTMYCCDRPAIKCQCWDPASGRLRSKSEIAAIERVSAEVKALTAGPSSVSAELS